MAVNVEQLIEKLRALPLDKQEKVLDYIEKLNSAETDIEIEVKPVVRIMSPRLVHPEQIADFKMEVIEEKENADV